MVTPKESRLESGNLLSFRLLDQFAKTGNFKDFNSNMIDAEDCGENSALHKGSDVLKKSQSPSPNGETKPNNNNSSQQENEGQNPNDVSIDEETPMKRLITALKQARAEKDAREAEERERQLQEQAIIGIQSPVSKSKTIAFGLITVED